MLMQRKYGRSWMLFRSTRKSISRTKNGWSYCRRSSSTSCAERARSCRPLAVTRSITATAFTFARRAAIRFTARRRNSIRAPAGRVSGSRSAKKRFTKAARPRRSSEWKFRAPVADRISDMSSMTDLAPTGLRYCMNAVALTYREASPGSAPALPRADQNRP